MKAVVLRGHSISFDEVPLIPIPETWARVRVESAGLCGTDVAKLAGMNLPANHTDILGHEFIGQVVAMEGKSDAIALNDWVACMPLIACGKCESCLKDRMNLCIKATAIGRTIQGSFAEFVNVPLENLVKIPSTSNEAFVLADPLAVCIHAKNLVKGICSDSNALVIGDGPIGCLLAWLLVKQGQRVAIKGIHSENLRFAESFGAFPMETEVGVNSYETVYETVGRNQSQTLQEACRAVKPGGNIVVLGVYAPGYCHPLIARDLFIKEVHLIGANAYVRNDFRDAVDLIKGHCDELTKFLSHRFPLALLESALALARNKTGLTMKIVLKPGGTL